MLKVQIDFRPSCDQTKYYEPQVPCQARFRLAPNLRIWSFGNSFATKIKPRSSRNSQL